VLFGSYARGDWVADPVGGYFRDYDLLVVVNHEKLTDVLEYWTKAQDHLVREYTISHRLTAPANFIVHSLREVNRQLKKGRPFFIDIVRDGIALYEAPNHPFDRPGPLAPVEALSARNAPTQNAASLNHAARIAAGPIAKSRRISTWVSAILALTSAGGSSNESLTRQGYSLRAMRHQCGPTHP
jgi:predicted nucleotidyltransferase